MADKLEADVKADVSLSSPIIFAGASAGLHSLTQFSELNGKIVMAKGGKLYFMDWNDRTPFWRLSEDAKS